MGRTAGKRLYSIRKLQLMMVFLFIVPILALQLIQNLYSLQEFHSEMEQNGKGTIYLYQNQMEMSIRRIETSVAGYWAQDYSHGRLRYGQDELDAYRYSYDVVTEYKALMNSEPILAGMFILSVPNRTVKGALNTGSTSYLERSDMWELAKQALVRRDSVELGKWAPVSMGGRYFLVRSFGGEEAFTLCVVDLEQTIKPQDAPYFPQDSFLLYADAQGTPLTSAAVLEEAGIQLRAKGEGPYFSGSSPSYFIVQAYSELTGMSVVFLEAYPGSLHKMNQILLLILLLSALILALVPLLFLMLKKWYLRPMEQMTRTLKKIRTGELSARFCETQKVEELQQLSTSFNAMMDEVKNLKIEAYESEIQYQYAELQYLQLQISPHFFLNILKTLYGMAEKKRFDKIQNAILMISDHVRYSFHDNKERVPLETELRHVENYIRMQQYVTSHEIQFRLDVDEDAGSVEVPVLCVQTFVENSCKYAMLPDRKLIISVTIQRLYSEEGDRADLTITDNGPGIPRELLEEYNGSVSFEHREEHIGILNLRQRLYLLYGEQCGFACMNGNPGAVFELVIPIGAGTDTPPEQAAQTEKRRNCNGGTGG